MKKVVLKVELYDDRIKQKAMKTVSGISGVESVSVDMKDKKLTITGDIDPVHVVSKLRKLCHTEIVSVGPAKEEKNKKEESNKSNESKKVYEAAYPLYYYHSRPPHHYVTSVVEEEYPNGCVIS